MTGSVEISAFEAIVELIKTVGFPIFVALWFMLRTDKKLDALMELTRERRR